MFSFLVLLWNCSIKGVSLAIFFDFSVIAFNSRAPKLLIPVYVSAFSGAGKFFVFVFTGRKIV